MRGSAEQCLQLVKTGAMQHPVDAVGQHFGRVVDERVDFLGRHDQRPEALAHDLVGQRPQRARLVRQACPFDDEADGIRRIPYIGEGKSSRYYFPLLEAYKSRDMDLVNKLAKEIEGK